MKTVLIVLAIVMLLCGLAHSQGELVELEQNGFSTMATYLKAEGISGFGMELKWTVRGKADFGLAMGSTANVKTLAATFSEHVFRRSDPGGAEYIISLNQAFSFHGPDFFPNQYSLKILTIGSSVTLKTRRNGNFVALIQASIFGHFPLERGIDSEFGYQVAFTPAFYGRPTWLHFSPSITSVGGITTYGITIGLTKTNTRGF